MIRSAAQRSMLTIAALAVLAVIGLLTAIDPTFALVGAVAVLLVGLVTYRPVAVPVLAMPALVVVERVGGGGIDLTLSDVALFGAFWVALLFAPRPFSRAMRSMLWLSAIYQVTTLFTVVVNPYLANTIEWFHAWLSVGGALLVGWAVGRAGHARLGVTLLMAPCLAIATLTCLAAIQQLAVGNTDPVYLAFPFAMHKNFIGGVLAIAALIAYARPVWVRWPWWFSLTAFLLCTGGVAAAQARQWIIGLAVGVVVISLRPDPDQRRSKLVLIAIAAGIYAVWAAVQDQLGSDNEFNSANQRLSWYEDAIDVWLRNPLFGMGLRWWTAGRTEFVFQPPNAELEVLSSAGLLGLLGFLILFLGGLIVLWRLDPRYGTLAVSMLLMRLAAGQFDLFWVAVHVSLPFAVIGVCLGAHAADRRARRGDRPAGSSRQDLTAARR